jgi:hypothetical protein
VFFDHLSFDHIDQKNGQKWSKMVKDGQTWSKMVKFKFLTTFGETAEKSVVKK